MNYIPEIAKMLGVEIGEEFRITNDNDRKIRFKFIEKGLKLFKEDGGYWIPATEYLLGILNGYHEIIKFSNQFITDEERKYLSDFIGPWRYKANWIEKVDNKINNFEHIEINVKSETENYEILLPDFKKGTMYKGMEVGKTYLLKELDL